jgi:hypothetical protein
MPGLAFHHHFDDVMWRQVRRLPGQGTTITGRLPARSGSSSGPG